MHMADALISPTVGGAMWVVSGALIAISAKNIRAGADDRKIPLMGVLGSFIFAAQMINFTIPGTGSSGHLGGGMLLSILLGPSSAFLVMASVLTVQALFFADGGLLALGCNIFNLGFFTCFVAYPLVYKKIVGSSLVKNRIVLGATLAGTVGLQLGAIGVVLETVASGISELPFKTFLLLMLPIHLGIGLGEGMVTAGVVVLMMVARPEILVAVTQKSPIEADLRKAVTGLALASLIVGGALSWFASTHPDGLEWAMQKTSSKEELENAGPIHGWLGSVQKKTALLPDYGYAKSEALTEPISNNEDSTLKTQEAKSEGPSGPVAVWPAVDAGTSLAGFVGGLLSLLLAGLIGIALHRSKRAA